MFKKSIFGLLGVLILLQGCAVQKSMVATGGSRSDGTVKLSYEFGVFEIPQVNMNEGTALAKKRCESWGYKDAEAFGGQTKTCNSYGGGSCNKWLVTLEFQCTQGSGAQQTTATAMAVEKPLPMREQISPAKPVAVNKPRLAAKQNACPKGFFPLGVIAKIEKSKNGMVTEWMRISDGSVHKNPSFKAGKGYNGKVGDPVCVDPEADND